MRNVLPHGGTHMFHPIVSPSRISFPLSIFGKLQESIRASLVRRWHEPRLVVTDSLWLFGAATWLVIGVLVWLTLLTTRFSWRAMFRSYRILRWSLRPQHAVSSLLLVCLLCSSTPAAPQTVISVAQE